MICVFGIKLHEFKNFFYIISLPVDKQWNHVEFQVVEHDQISYDLFPVHVSWLLQCTPQLFFDLETILHVIQQKKYTFGCPRLFINSFLQGAN